MANYSYKEVTDALKACGFVEVKNNNGSHQLFVHQKTGFAQPVPKHSNSVVASGTAESILDYAIMQARISNLNIANDKFKLSKNVIEYIKKQHKKIKEDIKNLVPQAIRKQCNLQTKEEVVKFIKEKTKVMQKEYNNKNSQKQDCMQL